MELSNNIAALGDAQDEGGQMAALEKINSFLMRDIVAREHTAAELDALVRSFFVENPIDNLGTCSAMVTYALAMNIVINEKSTDLATDGVFNMVTNLGLSASFLCGLSFTSSSYDQVQEYRRVHLRTKNTIYNNVFMTLMLNAMSNNSKKVTLLLKLAESEVRVLSDMLESNRLLLRTKELRNTPPDEIERIKEETDILEIQLFYAREKVKTIQGFQKSGHVKKDNKAIQSEIEEQKRRIIDILKRPMYEADVDYSSTEMKKKDEAYEHMASTSLYAKKKEIEAKLEKTTGGETDPIKKATRLRLLQDKETIQEQIDYYWAAIDGLDQITKSSHTVSTETSYANTSPAEPTNTTSPPATQTNTEKLITFLSPLDARTKSLWRNEARELNEFRKTIQHGLTEGITQLIKADQTAFDNRDKTKWHDGLSRIDFAIRKKLETTKTPVWRQFCIGLYLIWSIPFFLYHAFSNISNLLDNLKRVIDALHKSSRDVDLALRHHSKDSFAARLLIRYPLQLAWAAITFIPETMGGIAYYFLSFLRKDSNVNDVSRAINPPRLADWIQKHSSTTDSNLKKSGLYLLIFLGGILNTFWAPIKKILSIVEIDKSNDTIRASRDTLSAAWEIFASRVKLTWYNVFHEPIVSAWTQIAEQQEHLAARYPFRTSPLRWILNHCFIPFQFAGNVLLNVIVRSLYLFVKNLAKTAPVITASVITISTLMTGLTVPYVFSLTLEHSTQMWLAMAATLGDTTNSTHDAYNLSNAILRDKQKKAAEVKAIEKMGNSEDTKAFATWKTVYERIEEGAYIAGKINAANTDKIDRVYKKIHLNAMKPLIATTNEPDLEKVETILARHLAYFLVNTSKNKSADEYNLFFDKFKNNTDIKAMAEKLLETMPKSLSNEEKMHYILSSTTLLGYDYAKQVNASRYQNYKNDTFYIKIGHDRIKMVRSVEDPNKYIQKDASPAIVAVKLSWWERITHAFTRDTDTIKIVNGYKITFPTTPNSTNKLTASSRQTTALYLVKNDGTSPIRGERRDGDLFYFPKPNSSNQFYIARELYSFESTNNKMVIGNYVIQNMRQDEADAFKLEWQNPVNKINVNKGLQALSSGVTKETRSLCMFRGFVPEEKCGKKLHFIKP